MFLLNPPQHHHDQLHHLHKKLQFQRLNSRLHYLRHHLFPTCSCRLHFLHHRHHQHHNNSPMHYHRRYLDHWNLQHQGRHRYRRHRPIHLWHRFANRYGFRLHRHRHQVTESNRIQNLHRFEQVEQMKPKTCWHDVHHHPHSQ